MGFEAKFLLVFKDKQYFFDQRVAASFVLYPKPFGVQGIILVKASIQ
jgi:hypothetical protein